MRISFQEELDQLDRQIPGSREWHYDDVPICTTKPYAEYCPNGTCASTQLPRHYRRLVDVHETRNRKQFAVIVLTHLMGDIHKPLHAADNDDNGGNQIKVSLPDGRDRYRQPDTERQRGRSQQADFHPMVRKPAQPEKSIEKDVSRR